MNNLCTIEKVIEQYILGHLELHLINNNVLHNNHHGGRKGHSTITALNQIFDIIGKNYEQNNIVGVIITDLSKAYDTVDHFTLLAKLEYYGIRGQSLDIFKSYLEDRYQLVEIDTNRSQLKKSLDCSVVQGSKMSGILYTIYTNEIPMINKLINNDIFEKNNRTT